MSTDDAADGRPSTSPRPARRPSSLSILRLVASIAIPIVAFFVLWATFDFLRDADANRLLVVGRRDRRGRGRRVLPLLGDEPGRRLPAGALSGRRPPLHLRRTRARDPGRVPRSIRSSTRSSSSFKDSQGESFVGLDNFRFVFTDQSMLRAIRNTFGWIVIVPLFGVAHRARVRDAGRPLAPGRGGREVDDLPADGDLVRRGRRSPGG